MMMMRLLLLACSWIAASNAQTCNSFTPSHGHTVHTCTGGNYELTWAGQVYNCKGHSSGGWGIHYGSKECLYQTGNQNSQSHNHPLNAVLDNEFCKGSKTSWTSEGSYNGYGGYFNCHLKWYKGNNGQCLKMQNFNYAGCDGVYKMEGGDWKKIGFDRRLCIRSNGDGYCGYKDDCSASFGSKTNSWLESNTAIVPCPTPSPTKQPTTKNPTQHPTVPTHDAEAWDTATAYSVEDTRSGCPRRPFRADTALISKEVHMHSAGTVLITASMIRRTAGRADLYLYIDGSRQARALSHTTGDVWESVDVTYAASLAAGTHVVDIRGNRPDIWGCGSTLGSINIAQFESDSGVEAIHAEDQAPVGQRSDGAALIETTINMEEDGFVFLNTAIISRQPGRSDFIVKIDNQQVRRALTFNEVPDLNGWTQPSVAYSGPLSAGSHTVQVYCTAGSAVNFGWGGHWGQINGIKIPHNTGTSAFSVADTRSGCPSSGVNGQNLITAQLKMERNGHAFINAGIISKKDGRRDVTLYLDDVELNRHIADTTGYIWDMQNVYWGGSVSAGTHTVTLKRNDAHGGDFGCQDEWGNINIVNIGGAVITESPTSSPTNTPTESPTNTPTQSPTESPTNTPTQSPTNTPTTAEQLRVQRLTEALNSHEWETAYNGDDFFKCNRLGTACYVSQAGARNTWSNYEGTPPAQLGPNMQITTADGTVFDMGAESIEVTADGDWFVFPYDCECQE